MDKEKDELRFAIILGTLFGLLMWLPEHNLFSSILFPVASQAIGIFMLMKSRKHMKKKVITPKISNELQTTHALKSIIWSIPLLGIGIVSIFRFGLDMTKIFALVVSTLVIYEAYRAYKGYKPFIPAISRMV